MKMQLWSCCEEEAKPSMTHGFDILLRFVRYDFNDMSILSSDSYDRQVFTKCLDKHKLTSIVCQNKDNNLPKELHNAIRQERKRRMLLVERMRELIHDLDCEARREGKRFTVIKGIALNDRIYGSVLLRDFGDIDILILPEDADSFHMMLCAFGFSQKAGPTSSGATSDSYTRAFLAAHAKNSNSIYESLIHPIKSHPGKSQYNPYVKTDNPSFELHDGFYKLSDEIIRKIIKSGSNFDNMQFGHVALDDVYIFIFLIINTYENSESFFSNSYDYSAVLRDYVDLRYFFKQHLNDVDWREVEQVIIAFGLSHVVEICLGNLLEIYERDVTLGCLPSFQPRSSEWHTGIVERMKDTDLARSKSLLVMRERFRAIGESSMIAVPRTMDTPNKQNYRCCASSENTLFSIEHTFDSFVLSWLVPESHQSKGAYFLYQFRFFPLSQDITYTSYKVDLSMFDNEYKAYGHSTKRHYSGAVRKRTSTLLPITLRKNGGYLEIRIELPFDELGLSGTPNAFDLCVAADVFIRYHDDIYRRLNPDLSDDIMSLVSLSQ
jgi:hypothetical protein